MRPSRNRLSEWAIEEMVEHKFRILSVILLLCLSPSCAESSRDDSCINEIESFHEGYTQINASISWSENPNVANSDGLFIGSIVCPTIFQGAIMSQETKEIIISSNNDLAYTSKKHRMIVKFARITIYKPSDGDIFFITKVNEIYKPRSIPQWNQ